MFSKLMPGKLIIISAPSGSGKTTIVNHLLTCGLGLEFSVSATTRAPRGTERNGVEYYFLSVKEFKDKIASNELIEWEEVYKDNYYGTLKSELDRIWANGNHVLFDVDVKGGVNLKKLFGSNALSVFISPPSVAELERRLKARGTDTPERIKIRVAKAALEMELMDRFDAVVINDNLDQAKSEVQNLITSFLK
jgi:guanylate kinase